MTEQQKSDSKTITKIELKFLLDKAFRCGVYFAYRSEPETSVLEIVENYFKNNETNQ